MTDNGASPSSSPSSSSPPSRALLVLVVDVSPVVWNERDLKRAASDKNRLAAGKRSVGPATLPELLQSIETFCGAFLSLDRKCAMLVVGVAGNESALLFPRKDVLEQYFADSNGANSGSVETKPLPQQLLMGVTELVQRPGASQDDTASMAAGLSKALCLVNRYLVSANSMVGVSALKTDTSHLYRQDDEGLLSIMGGSSESSRHRHSTASTPGAWSPRILLIQASADRSRDYNAFMNCAFCAIKLNVVLDGCFIVSGMSKDPKNSAFLEQACDRSGGIYLSPSGAAQVGPALTEVLMSVFLAPPSVRSALHLPAIQKVDFRARCFDTFETADIAYVCNQCLSIFQNKPKGCCPTCGAPIRTPGTNKNGSA